MLGRRCYSDAAKARQLLKNAFERMQKPGYVKSAAQKDEMVEAAKTLDIAPNVVEQVYRSTMVAPAPSASARGAPAGTDRVARQKAARQADIDMFGPPQSQQLISRDFQYDDLPSAGHLQLEEHRDARELFRAASYELPLLAQYRSAYRPPVKSTTNLQFRHFAFPTEPKHPAVPKVTVSFKVSEIEGLSKEQMHKLRLLAGSHLDTSRDLVKISAARFSTQAQNKRYLVQTYERLLQAAKDDSDMFADVLVDERATRNRLAKKRSPKFNWPKEWRRTDLAPVKRDDICSVL